MSNADRPEFRALAELERVLKHITDELASWRRRALKAESDRVELGVDHDIVGYRERIAELERENADVVLRLTTARTRVDDLFTRLRFLEEQAATEESTP